MTLFTLNSGVVTESRICDVEEGGRFGKKKNSKTASLPSQHLHDIFSLFLFTSMTTTACVLHLCVVVWLLSQAVQILFVIKHRVRRGRGGLFTQKRAQGTDEGEAAAIEVQRCV